MTARPIRYQRQVSDRNGKIFYTSIASLSHISKNTRLETMSHGTGKTVGVTCEQDIITAILSGFDCNRIFHNTEKRMHRMAYWLHFFII